MASWLSDFEIKNGSVYVKSTGATVALNASLVRETLAWFPFFIVEKIKALPRLLSRKPRLKIAFTPVSPRPWYMIWVAAHRAGAQFVQSHANAHAVFYFEDQTTGSPPPLPKHLAAKAFNFACTDISKSTVGKTFEEIFGYALAVDPNSYNGPIAVKSEINGAHDGYIATGPLERQKGLVYQKLVDNSAGGKWAQDLRCPIVGGEIKLIYIKHRPLESRFANMNSRVTLAVPADYLSASELAKLKQLACAMGLDWGGMDVLRDNQNGKIYVVDVNKTEMGPPINMPLKDKAAATKVLAAQFLDLVGG